MDAIEAIMSRRSIRRFTDESIPAETIEALLRAAMAAPSAFNEQPWHFVVVRDAEARRRLSTISPYAGPMAGASVGVVVCGDTAALKNPGTIYWVYDCVAALENLLIAADAVGLGAVWLGIQPWTERVEAVRDVTSLPEGVEPLGMVALGFPAESKEPADRFDEARVHDETW